MPSPDPTPTAVVISDEEPVRGSCDDEVRDNDSSDDADTVDDLAGEEQIICATEEPSSLVAVDRIRPKTRTEKKAFQRLRWQPQHTITFLELLVECRNEGQLYNDKSTLVAKVMESIVPKMLEKYPLFPWSSRKLCSHYKVLRTKHRQFKWWEGRTGHHYDERTGIIDASKEQWAAFDQRFGKAGAWLRAQGMPHADLYEQVFIGNKARGGSMVNAALINSDSEIEETVRELMDNDDIEEDTTVEVDDTQPSSQLELSSRPRPKPSFSINRRLSSSSSPTVKRRKTASDDTLLVEEIRSFSSKLTDRFEARQKPKPVDIPGGWAVSVAVADCKRKFGLQSQVLARFAEALRDPMEAVIWNSIGDDREAKKAILERLIGVDVDEDNPVE
ncbi:hypothetical protein B0I35DRAFT_517194 [Stachybotrys elegans]|uniref:Myb/SANT-like domain-containing protein n=1 Tax=Stachybotrys elegans TaxID=80388 RepID=A0A8K0S917_9HYPO|nr:hypothetical protein B0I35DRAFT_517194 [Stachybotrys elegans]